jgi:4a-hydroxytetrahydrobiopterin dehydratase
MVPCPQRPVIGREEAETLMPQLSDRWRVGDDATSIQCSIRLPTFAAAVALIDAVFRVADALNHHPNVCLKRGSRVELELMTFMHNGLTLNDFILAARLDPDIAAATV